MKLLVSSLLALLVVGLTPVAQAMQPGKIVFVFENHEAWGQGDPPRMQWVGAAIGDKFGNYGPMGILEVYVTDPAAGTVTHTPADKLKQPFALIDTLDAMKPAGKGFFSPATLDLLGKLKDEPQDTHVFYVAYAGACGEERRPSEEVLAAIKPLAHRFWPVFITDQKGCAPVVDTLQPGVSSWVQHGWDKESLLAGFEAWNAWFIIGSFLEVRLADADGNPVDLPVELVHSADPRYSRTARTNFPHKVLAWTYRVAVQTTPPLEKAGVFVRGNVEETVDLGRLARLTIKGDGEVYLADADQQRLREEPVSGTLDLPPGTFHLVDASGEVVGKPVTLKAGETQSVTLP